MTFVDYGSTAIHLLDNNPFDVVVADMQMPLISGWNYCDILIISTYCRQTPKTGVNIADG